MLNLLLLIPKTSFPKAIAATTMELRKQNPELVQRLVEGGVVKEVAAVLVPTIQGDHLLLRIGGLGPANGENPRLWVPNLRQAHDHQAQDQRDPVPVDVALEQRVLMVLPW